MTLDYFDFKINLGKTIKLTGNAVNSKLGALLVGENFSIGIEVPEGTDLKNAGHRYLLQNVKWKQ